MFSTCRLLLSFRTVSSLQDTVSKTSRAFYHSNVKPLQKLGEDFPNVGMILCQLNHYRPGYHLGRFNDRIEHFYPVGSGIYDDGIIISAAHCFKQPLGTPIYFALGGDSILHPIKIKTVVKHPAYDPTITSPQSDIAIAFLEQKLPIAMPKLNIEYQPTDEDLTDCVNVGYPTRYSPRQENDEQIPTEQYRPCDGQTYTPIGVLASCERSTDFPNCLDHKIGYKKSDPVTYNILDSGGHMGMSGGGLFTQKDKKLLGIYSLGTNDSSCSYQRGDIDSFSLLAAHKAFITNQINKFKKDSSRLKQRHDNTLYQDHCRVQWPKLI